MRVSRAAGASEEKRYGAGGLQDNGSASRGIAERFVLQPGRGRVNGGKKGHLSERATTRSRGDNGTFVQAPLIFIMPAIPNL